MAAYTELKAAAYAANMELPKSGLVIFTFGNVSAVDRSRGVFAIKPSGVPYEELKVQDMVVVDFDNKVVEGKLRPSSDTKTHAALYKHFEVIGGIAHTHSKFAPAWAQTQRDIPIYGTTHADYLAGDIPCAPPMSDEMIKGDYEHETGYQIINCLKERKLSPADVQMILIANHAPFTWGKDAAQAVYHSALLEAIAEMAYLTEQIRPDSPRLKDALVKKHHERKHGPNSYYGQK